MPKKLNVQAAKRKANTNVTIIKFKTPETAKRKQALVLNTEEQDPLVRNTIHIQPNSLNSTGLAQFFESNSKFFISVIKYYTMLI